MGVSLGDILIGWGEWSSRLPRPHFSLSEGRNRAAMTTAGRIAARLQNETSRAGGLTGKGWDKAPESRAQILQEWG